MTVELTTTSATGEFSISGGDPWTATLTTTIASGETATSVYFRDSQPGSATISAATEGKSTATQTNTIGSGGGGSGGGGGVDGGGGGGSADLYLTGSVAPASVAIGGTLTWQLRLSDDKNYGSAAGAYVDVTLPAGVQIASTSTDRGPGCSSSDAGKLRCSLDWLSRDAPYGNVTLITNVTAGGELVLTATAGSSAADPNPADNTLVTKANTPATPPPVTPPIRTPSSQKGVTKTGTAKRNVLVGTAFADVLRGLGGNDSLNGKAGADKLNGGSGNDTLLGGLGADLLEGGPGNDTIRARDGIHDTIRCGTGRDTVAADRTDLITPGCEKVTRR